MGRIYCQDSRGDSLNPNDYEEIILPMMHHISHLERRIAELEAKINED